MNKEWLFTIFVLLLIACQTTETLPKEEAMPTTLPINYLALGDSYTIGESVPANENYPNQLATELTAKGVAINSPTIIAKTGWTTGELSSNIKQAKLDTTTFDLVSLLIGVNNQYRGLSSEVYKKEFDSLLQTAIQFAGSDTTKVFVISIPDYAYTPFGQKRDAKGISEGIDLFNSINKTITEQYGIRYFDITPISREGITRPALVADDTLHPSGMQYKEWVGGIVGEVQAMLE